MQYLLQTRAKLKKSLKNILNCCKTQIMFKNITKLGNVFHFNDRIKPKNNSVAEHLLFCKHSEFYDDFTFLTCENKKFYWN